MPRSNPDSGWGDEEKFLAGEERKRELRGDPAETFRPKRKKLPQVSGPIEGLEFDPEVPGKDPERDFVSAEDLTEKSTEAQRRDRGWHELKSVRGLSNPALKNRQIDFEKKQQEEFLGATKKGALGKRSGPRLVKKSKQESSEEAA